MLSDSPPERDLQWTETGIASSFKFINKLYEIADKYNYYKSNNHEDVDIINSLKSLINEVSENIENFQFNKSVAKIYEFVNILNSSVLEKKLSEKNLKWSLEKLSVILQPFVPHISEEIWSRLGNKTLCINEVWPIEKVKKKSTTNIAIQINGKTKEVIQIENKISKGEILDIVKNNNKIKKSLIGKNVVKEIYVPGKIVNLVIK